MSSSSSSSSKKLDRLRPDLPLIRCNECGRADVVERLSKTDRNPNHIFFVCPFHQKGGRGCRFFYWVEEYEALLAKLQGAKEKTLQKGDVEEQLEEQPLIEPLIEGGRLSAALDSLVNGTKTAVALLKVLVAMSGCMLVFIVVFLIVFSTK